jgi:type I restriction enzyme M protein
MDAACGSGGFLLHAMDWCYPATDSKARELRNFKYASKYLWGIDFETSAARTSRALMLIAGDGHTNIFGPDVDSLDPKTWYETASGQTLMLELRKAKLTANKIPENEALKDDELAWDYFDELRFDVILANPPFAGEKTDRKMLARYELAKPALKRAQDKTPKEERDVLFIERILKMLKPGGRAAIVLPQGKFNNSSLGFIREWILKKARLLAVVGLHPNTFKPHTGTKTSVLFMQKYTKDQLDQIAKVHDQVAGACPDYEAQIRSLLKTHETALDVPEESIPEAVADLITERFSEPEPEETTDDEGSDENDEGNYEASGTDEDRAAQADEKVNSLKAELINAKKKLTDLDIDYQALAQQQGQEIGMIAETWKGKKGELKAHLTPIKAGHSAALASLMQKDKRKVIKAEIKALEKGIPRAEVALKLLGNRGKLTLVLEDVELIGTLKERWIAAEVAKQLDYPIFMAVSERGGKDNSGNYKYVSDEQGSLVEFPAGHLQEGQLVVDQDLVNYNLRAADLAVAAKIPDYELCIAEVFVRFAQGQNFSFWEPD